MEKLNRILQDLYIGTYKMLLRELKEEPNEYHEYGSENWNEYQKTQNCYSIISPQIDVCYSVPFQSVYPQAFL